jgi:hypothetical protein
MEKRFEIKLRQAREDSARREPLRRPEKNGRRQGAEKNGGCEIAEQSGCVFHEANVRFPPDAESTHMEGERRGGAKARGSRDQVWRRVAVSGQVCRRIRVDLL